MPAPNKTQLSIHSIPLTFLPEDEDQLLPYLHESIRNAMGVSILSARYLNSNPESRSHKSATAIVVLVSPSDAEQVLPSINLFSRTAQWKRCTPLQDSLRVPSAGNSAMSRLDAPASLQALRSAPSPTPSRSITVLTLPALKVAISTQSSAAAHPQWHAVLTAKKSTLRAAWIAPPGQRPLKINPRHPLERHRMLWTLPMTRRARRNPRILLPTLHSKPQPLYSPAMLCLLGRDPGASSLSSSQESL